jgi:feruloyl esterase
MKTQIARGAMGAALLVGATWAVRPAVAADCTALAHLQLPDTTITLADAVPAGSFTPPGAPAIPNLPAFCRVTATLKPTPQSDIRVEMWMPQSGWNGVLNGTGNGGYAGKIIYDELASGLRLGFAVVNTDMGTGPATTLDGEPLVGQPEKWADFGWRSTHLMTEFGKKVASAFYRHPARHTLFSGCSTGGGQALHEAEQFPEDYDGILAGAPAENRTHVHTDILWDYAVTHATNDSVLSAETATLVTKAVVVACGKQSGSLPNDAFLTDPRSCHWDPGTLECKGGGQTSNCLTAPQVQALRLIYDGPRDPQTRALIYPGMNRGSESGSVFALPFLDGASKLPGEPANQPTFDGLFYWAFGKNWDWRKFNYAIDMAKVDDVLAKDLNANSPDLKRFAARSGKLILYHGWADPLVVPQDDIDYYLRVVAIAGGLQQTQSFARLFMAPGMGHCFGGPGPNSFGGWFHKPVPADPDHNILLALQRWVDQGIAPERVIATKYKDDNPAHGVAMTRPLCPFPEVARYKGSGPSNEAASFECVLDNNNDNPKAAAQYLR